MFSYFTCLKSIRNVSLEWKRAYLQVIRLKHNCHLSISFLPISLSYKIWEGKSRFFHLQEVLTSFFGLDPSNDSEGLTSKSSLEPPAWNCVPTDSSWFVPLLSSNMPVKSEALTPVHNFKYLRTN